MKKIVVFGAALLCAQFSYCGAPSKVAIERRCSQLRTRHGEAEKAYSQFCGELAGETAAQGDSVEQQTASRLGEFRKLAGRIAIAKAAPLPESQSGASRMWASRKRGAVAAVDASEQFNCGPGKSVAPSTGEYFESTADFTFSERGGLGFSFTRRYASYSEFDCGFGVGWDHDFNAGIVFDAETPEIAKSCVVFWQGQEIHFEKLDGAWIPEKGCFFSLVASRNKMCLLSPLLVRIEFEPAAERGSGVSRWRLSAIASRHDNWMANRIELSYLPNCDRLKSIRGVRGEQIDFAYDKDGHIVGINSKSKSVRYEYAGDLLVKVLHSPVTMSMAGESDSPTVLYDYIENCGVKRISRKQHAGQTYWMEVSYDECGRANSCGYVSADARQTWQMTYLPSETIATAPKPSADVHYYWGGTPHATLPSRIEVPTQKSVLRYMFNDDYLPIEEIDALGTKTVYEYDATNPNRSMRGNLLAERRLAGQGEAIKWREFGVRTAYEKEIALPVSSESYQTATNGVEEIVRRELFKYRRGDYSLIEKRETGGAGKGGISERYLRNRYGEVGLMQDANDNATIYEYADGLPSRPDFDFARGSAANGGWLARKIEDANDDQIKTACRALGAIVHRKKVRVKPCAVETQYAWDCDGNQIREKRGHNERLALYNEKGAVLAEFGKGAGLELTEYFPDGRIRRILGEFCPGEKSAYSGQGAFFFGGRFKESAFAYDSLGQMTSRRMTDEKIEGVAPNDAFVRYPSGKLAKIINPSGVTRVDTYDFETGFMVSQAMAGSAGDISLGRVLERFPDGSVRVSEDQSGAVWTNRLDSFGRPYETVSCMGTTKRTLKDALDRAVETCEFDASKIYSLAKTEYSKENGLVERELTWKSNDGVTGEWIESAHHLYDEAGNEVCTKGVHENDWTYSLYDGLGRRVANVDSAGNCSITVYDADSEAYSYAISMRDDTGKEGLKQGKLLVLDGAGRPVETIPVDSNGSLVRERRVKNSYNAVGQMVRMESMGLTATEREYNSLGWIVREKTLPMNCSQGECPVEVMTTFRADGKVIRRELGNTSLALIGDKASVRPEQVDAPQITHYDYDEYGRLAKTENPDGLMLSSGFNSHSMPSKMTWTHNSSADVLREIKLNYSPLGQVSRLVDGKTDATLQEFEYDGSGRLVKAIDWNNGEQVVILSKYDTLGQAIESASSLPKCAFPVRKFAYDPVKGNALATWDGQMHGVFWGSENYRFDSSGRLVSISLDSDKEPTVKWKYMGTLPVRRESKTSRIDTVYEYSALGELQRQQMRGSRFGEDAGALEYAYDPKGAMFFSSTYLNNVDNAGDYQFASYSHFDDFRRLTGQNAESFIPYKDDRQKEWDRVFGVSGRSIANQSTLRMRYDQANNIWVKYQGEEFEGEPDKFRKDQSPTFISSARPFPEGVSPVKQELASNRDVTNAAFGNDALVADVKEYDLLGNLVEFKGSYWDGAKKIPAKWKLEYDTLGRLARMEARSDDFSENAIVKQGDLAGVLEFAYDAQNRRVMKRVVDRPDGKASTNTTFTAYAGTRQWLVYENTDGNPKLVEEYLWGVGQREVVMAALTSAEKDISSDPVRYYFQQDQGFNTVLVTKNEDGKSIPVSASSYLGFGENATSAKIKDIESSMGSRDSAYASNSKKDDELTATWIPGLRSQQFIELRMHDARKLANMTIWGAKGFPRDFLVYVLPEGTDSPNKDGFDLNSWHLGNRDCLAAVVKDGFCQGYQKQDSDFSPYKASLGDRRGDRIVIAWEQKLESNIEIKEIEILCTPNNPSAIAYAGQWLDRESEMYYQINRYRIAGSDKFISPDPLGFAAGNNLYAYANGNPLEWHDPDGRSPQLLAAAFGAAVGAIIGGGLYAVQSWLNGDDFSWKEFGIQVAVGAISGAISAGTFGLAQGGLSALGFGSSSLCLSAGASGFAGASTAKFSDTLFHGGEFNDALKSAAVEGLWGAAGGAIGGAIVGKFGAQLFRTVLSGAASGGIVSGTRTAFESYVETGDVWSSIGSGIGASWKGALGGAAIAGAGWGVGRAAGMIKPLKGYPEHLPDPRSKGVLIRTNAYNSPNDIPSYLRPFKRFLSYRDQSYDGVKGAPGNAVHHIKPVSLGGTTEKGNLTLVPIEQHSGPGNMHPGTSVNKQPYGTIFY